MSKTVRERFDEKWTPEPNTGCWLWFGATYVNDYGSFAPNGKKPRPAHRVSWELNRGPIQDGLVIDHLCRVKRCVNPDHLQPVPMAENTRRGRLHSAEVKAARRETFHRKITHCPLGHSYAEHGTMTREGTRKCAECNRIKCRARYEKRKGKVNGGEVLGP